MLKLAFKDEISKNIPSSCVPPFLRVSGKKYKQCNRNRNKFQSSLPNPVIGFFLRSTALPQLVQRLDLLG